MNAKKNYYSLAELLGMIAASAAKARDRRTSDAIDVESRRISGSPAPTKAIFNLKTEKTVPALDENGNPMYAEGASGENSPKKLARRAVPLDRPILASRVFFDDGTWTVVKNSSEDAVEVEEKTLSDGRTVKVATNASKERAIAYAIVKRMFGRIDPFTGEVSGANLGRRFDKIIAASTDQNVKGAEDKIKKAEAKPAQQAKPKKPARKCRQIDEKVLKELFGQLVGEFAKKLNPGKAADEAQQGA